MRAAIALAALLIGCVDVHVAQPPAGDLCMSLPSAPADLAESTLPVDLVSSPDLLPTGPRYLWLPPNAWEPITGAWIVDNDGSLIGSGTLRARLPSGALPTSLRVDYQVSAGSSARVWLRSWATSAPATTPASTTLLIAVKNTNFVLDVPVVGASTSPQSDATVDITDDGIGGPGTIRGVRLTLP